MAWVCVLPVGDQQEGSQEDCPVILRLPHPLTGQLVCFMLRLSDPYLLELQLANNADCSSWFIENTVQSDGRLYVFSPMDPLFLMLPILERQRRQTAESAGRFVSIDDLLHSDEYGSLARLAAIPGLSERLSSLCDCDEPVAGTKFFRLNDDKVMIWLKAKAEVLLQKYDTYQMLEVARMGEKHMDEPQRQQSRRSIVIRLLSDYLSPSWKDKLKEAYGLRKDGTDAGEYVYFDNIIKKPLSTAKMDVDQPQAKRKKLAPGQRSLANANKDGMKNISSFFRKKE